MLAVLAVLAALGSVRQCTAVLGSTVQYNQCFSVKIDSSTYIWGFIDVGGARDKAC